MPVTCAGCGEASPEPSAPLRALAVCCWQDVRPRSCRCRARRRRSARARARRVGDGVRRFKTSEDEEAEEDLDDGDNKVACLELPVDSDAYMRIAVHAPKVSEHGAVDFAVQASDAY